MFLLFVLSENVQKGKLKRKIALNKKFFFLLFMCYFLKEYVHLQCRYGDTCKIL